MSEKIPLTVVHHGRFNPDEHVGGVETFARSLRQIFDQVIFSTPDKRAEIAIRESLPVICDNQSVRDWPKDFPLIGFRHGVAAQKALITRSSTDLKLAIGQALAARRRRVVWVACAGWIRDASERWYRSETQHVVYHPIDLEKFDGRLDNQGSRVLLHDARSEHKGKRLLAQLQRRFPEWTFEALNCQPQEVAERMRIAAGFIHLSRYEGNSIVANEAMAMNLPCLFTDVGLMRDPDADLDVYRLDARRAFSDPAYLESETRRFLRSLVERQYQPRRWTERHATFEAARESWRQVLDDWRELAMSR